MGEGGLVTGRFRGDQRGARKGDCIGADQQGHGCLQRDGRGYWEQPCPQLFVLAGESSGCAGGIQRASRVQGCSEGSPALSQRGAWALMDVEFIWTCSLFGRAVPFRVQSCTVYSEFVRQVMYAR